MKVVFTRRVPGGVIERLSHKYNVRVGNVGITPRRSLLKIVEGADAIVPVLTEKIDQEVMERAGKQLKIIANYAVGYDNIDWKEARTRGIYVTNTASVLGDAVAEFAVALMMAVSRRIVDGDDFMRKGKYKGWDPEGFLGIDLTGKTIGVIGCGRIGSAIAMRSKAVYGMNIVYHQRNCDESFEKKSGAEFVSLSKLLRVSDVVAVAVPLTDDTYHMLGRGEFLKMKKSAIVINIARGKVISEMGLIWALKNRVIWGAGLDVFEDEMKVGLDYVHRQRLLRSPNVILTPHIASATVEARKMMADMVVESIERAFGGKEPKHLVWK